MRISSGLAAAALLITVSAPAASSPPSSTIYRGSQTLAPSIRLKERAPRLPSVQALFQGSFTSPSGKQYQLMGSGSFLPILIGDKSGYKYTVTLNAFPQDKTYPKLDFGQLQGQGTVDSAGTPGQVTFDILGTLNSNGYRLNVTGQISDGFMHGGFVITGGDGTGQGDFAGS